MLAASLIERLRRSRPITTSVAPRLGAPLDARRLELVPAVATALSSPAAHWSMPPSPPGYRPGVCHHPAHVVLEGERYGVMPISFERILSQAALTRCHHDNPAGC